MSESFFGDFAVGGRTKTECLDEVNKELSKPVSGVWSVAFQGI